MKGELLTRRGHERARNVLYHPGGDLGVHMYVSIHGTVHL